MSSLSGVNVSPSATIPSEDCTRDTFDQHVNLSDRQFLCWALQTETRVRFAKLEGRDDARAQDTTLNSDYLIDLYPDTGENKDDKGKLARERHAFARKSIPYLQSIRDPDMSFEALTRLVIDKPQSTQLKNDESKAKGAKCQAIPPNLLFFEIILEAYMGYRVPTFHSEDPTQPRAAIMGGAVVAALASWRDENVVGIFLKVETNLQEALTSDDAEKFQKGKENIRALLHEYFLYDHGPADSPFCLGDVDVFLQASLLSKSLMSTMQTIPQDVKDLICCNLGGCGFVHQDLQRFASALCGHLEGLFMDEWEYDAFCYALAKNGLSFALGTEEYGGFYFDAKKQTWPRTTQLIMLNEKADLVGGLMDFDISAASCAYNGISVYATPRAVFSLKTLTQVATPFVYEEKRNRSRITKYYKHGFDAFIIDPYCSHESPCYEHRKVIDPLEINVAPWQARDIVGDHLSRERRREIIDAQIEDDMEGIFICSYGNCPIAFQKFTVALIERSKGHAIKYFANRDNWSEEYRQEVMSTQEEFRFCCLACREEYAKQLILDELPPNVKSAETVEDLLHGELSYKHTFTFSRWWREPTLFGRSFYSAGAFNSEYVGKKARSSHQLWGVMRAQEILEEARYLRKHGSIEGYVERFVYGNNLQTVFRYASRLNFPSNGKAPVGLNPERFIAKCKACQVWLHECEYGVEYCENCPESKPAAVDDAGSKRVSMHFKCERFS